MFSPSTSSRVHRAPIRRSAIALLAVGTVGLGSFSAVQAQPRVQVNGRTLTTQVAPIQRNGRTLVPMRPIFRALGATLNWNRLTQEITGQFGTANVRLQIGRRNALVNGQRVRLEQPPILVRGATMVPLRFVAEGLGADVHWNDSLQLASISTSGSAGQLGAGENGQAVGGARSIVIPANAVVAVRLSSTLSSGDARIGDTFNAAVQSQRAGDSEFPRGTLLQGVVTAVQRRNGRNPGVLDVEFRSAVLPDGTRYPIRGDLMPLDESAVQTSAEGRVVARPAATRGDRLKIIGIGAGVGYVLGRVLKRNGLVTGVLGAAGGYLYNRARDRNRATEAVIPQGSTFGVRLVNSVAYGDSDGYRQQRADFLGNSSNDQ